MPGSRTAEQLRDAVGYLCRNWGAIEGVLADRDHKLMRRLQQAVRDQGPVEEILDKLHRAVVNSGDVHGLYGQTSRGESADSRGGDRALTGPGFGPGRRAEVVFLCPVRCCSRYEVAETGTPAAPRCDVADAAMRWERL